MKAGLFDFHQHFGEMLGSPGTPSLSPDEVMRRDIEVRVRVMEAAGIGQALLMPSHTYDRAGGFEATRAMNDRLSAYRLLDPAHFPAVIGTVEPRHGADAVAEVDRTHAELGFRGLSWHHRQQGLPMDHPVMIDCLSRMDALGMIAMIHCFPGADFEELWRIRRLAEAFPKVRFVVLDSMAAGRQFEEALNVGERTENIFLDITSTVIGPGGIERAVACLGASRIVFGTNLYSNFFHRAFAEIADVRRAAISGEAKALIFGGNARKLLGLG
jgi:predicted TIM-barrel fold metal-dependent hydrolase